MITKKFSQGEVVLGLNSIAFLECGCIGSCAYPSFSDHPNMVSWKILIDKQAAYYLPKNISFFDSETNFF